MIIEKIKNSTLTDILGCITSILFITGLSYQYGFYGYLGLNAPWVISLLGPKEILIVNIVLFTTYLMALLFLDSLLTKSDLDFKSLAIPANGCIIGLILFWGYFKDSWTGALFCFIVLLAFNSIISIIKLKIKFKIIGLIISILIIPFLNGVYIYHTHVEKNSLPKAILNNKDIWYLASTYSDKAVLISSMNFKKNIKIVDIKDIKLIESVGLSK
ncbi:hypothetical protein [Acinetobacter radioresistens]|uniref:hypothetical protein n=1 Tax=Acinetobacter radioresistens TaxID=40216 RepID=UPI000E717CA6|nr:hypothetical protein [Acinetobacter radioresistens]RJL71622.1 hypothetical protein D5055_08225 [Acinetobacter radioresistens]